MAFPIVAIGASAGGLEAVSELLAALPAHGEMAYVVILHLDPHHVSLLAELLGKKTAMPVQQIREGLVIEPGRVYVIPPNASLALRRDRFHLTPRQGSGPHHPVDTFFASLADVRADSAIGVVLSGGDADGSLGVQAIKHGGGITFAQTPESARFPGMPQHAIETDCVDFVLRPDAIAQELTRLGGHPYLRAGADAAPARRNDSQELSASNEEEALRRVFRRLRNAHSVDFTHYKRSTLHRRLARRMAVRRIEELADYVAVLEDDPAETAALYQDFLIRVTGFFRDPESFDGLRDHVFPSVCESRSPKDPIRIWVPGCATGEEVYSIAIGLVEYLGERFSNTGIQIFGTDVSEAAVEKARAARYLESITEDVSAERLKRFFVKEDAHYCIAKSIRDLCIFARQDVTRDPPFSRLDLVSCRNLLIYLDLAAQRRVMQVFHYSLRPKGFLLLGPSESVGTASDLFELFDKQHRIFTRHPAAPSAMLELGQGGHSLYKRTGGTANDEAPGFPMGDSAQREADRLLLSRYAPASLLVDEALNILQFRGETGRYLEHASGPPSVNLHRVVRPELLVEITPALQEARESGSAARRENLRVDDLTDVAVEVIPLKGSNPERCYLIVFEDGSRRASGRRSQSVAPALPESEKDRRLAQLEREIASTRDYMQAAMEEHEAVKEELKSAHEEVLSANEEFQSTNEELETSKEELQSTNEELTTTNEELRGRNRELALLNTELDKTRVRSEQARHYADAIIETVREPLLVLDGELKVLRANRAFYDEFSTRPELTEGRRLQDLSTHQWDLPALTEPLREVLTRDTALNDFELPFAAPPAALRTLKVNARKLAGDGDRAELILLGIEDVTERNANADHLLKESERKDEFLAMLAHELRNPLAPIRHATLLLRRGAENVPSVKLYDLIDRQTSRLTRLVDDLLDVARISSGHIQLKREPVDLAAVARQAAEASRPRIEEYHHRLSIHLPDTPVYVNGDPIRLEQIVTNLLENAIKYTEPGGRLELTVVRDHHQAILRMRDNGIGLAPESQEAIFGLFTQIDSSLARSGGGLGIGLTLVRRVLALHGGTIEARSAGLGQGAEFIVRLPAEEAEVRAVQSATHAPTHAPVEAEAGRRVLIVDDNPDGAESLALLARAWGHEVAVARDGPTALALAESFQPERALVDIGLPGMNGYELGRRLRDAHRDVYLIAMTGYGRQADRDAAHAAGFDLHLVKPADMEHLQEVLANGGAKSAG